MTSCTRRRFLSQTGRYAAAALIANGLPQAIRATLLGKPVGIQLYTVQDESERDRDGTPRQLRPIGLSGGYDLLLRETEPRLVQFEIDCGWMIFAGRDPVDYFGKYPNRFPMIHVKDFVRDSEPAGAKLGAMRGAELGRGVVDYGPILAAAEKAGLRHYFFEQEGPFHVAPMQAAQVAYDYLRAIR